MFLVAACAEEKPNECEKSSDCRQETCKTTQCVSGGCTYNTKTNCCGNKQQDQMEDGKPGNACSCPKDYGNCSGIVKTTVKGKEKNAQYVTQYCDVTSQCVKGVEPKTIVPIVLTQQLKHALYTLDVIIAYPNPLIINKDSVSLKLTLREVKPDLDLPLTLKRIMIVDNQRLFGQLNTNQVFNTVDKTIELSVPVTGETGLLESKLSLTYKIDEKHAKRIKGNKNPDGSYQYTTQEELSTLTGNLGADLVVVDLHE